jgi:hypothetical protein
MKYMLLLFDNGEWNTNETSEEDLAAEMELHTAFTTWCEEQGIAVTGGEALHSGSAATTVRRDGGSWLVTDGPAVEVKENLGGFYIIDCRDLDQAIEAAKKCPIGTANEVRPVWEFE